MQLKNQITVKYLHSYRPTITLLVTQHYKGNMAATENYSFISMVSPIISQPVFGME